MSTQLRRMMAWVLAPTPGRASIVAPLLRLAAGAIFIGFGLSKFLHHGREARSFARYGLPDPDVFVYAIGCLELGLGIALVLGLLTRLAALGLAGNMAGAIATGGRGGGRVVHPRAWPAP